MNLDIISAGGEDIKKEKKRYGQVSKKLKKRKESCNKFSIHTLWKKRQPDIDFRFPSLNSAIPLMNMSTTSLHQLYLWIFLVIAIEWKSRTHNFVLDVGNKRVLMANTSQNFNHLSSIEFFPLPDNHFSVSMNVGAF